MTRRDGSSYGLLAYAEHLRLGGDPRSDHARRLRHKAFPGGPTGQLAAMHAELVHPRHRRLAKPVDGHERHRRFLADESRRRAKRLARTVGVAAG